MKERTPSIRKRCVLFFSNAMTPVIASSRLRALDMIIGMGEMMKLSDAIVNRYRWKLPKHRQAMASIAVLTTADSVRDTRRLVRRYHSPLGRFKHDFPG